MKQYFLVIAMNNKNILYDSNVSGPGAMAMIQFNALLFIRE